MATARHIKNLAKMYKSWKLYETNTAVYFNDRQDHVSWDNSKQHVYSDLSIIYNT